MSGLGSAAGKLMEGDVLGAAGDAVGGVVSGVSSVVGGVVDTVSTVASSLNPLNWFKEGTNEVANTGLAVVHEGEAIVPAGVVSNMAAEGTGKFDPISWIGSLFGGGAKKPSGISGGVKQGSDESNMMKEFYFDLANSLKSIDGNVQIVTKFLTGTDVVSEKQDGGGFWDMLNPFNWFGGKGEVTSADKTGETRTMSAEESAEARLTRHKAGDKPQQVVAYTDTKSLEKVGLDQINILSQIRDGINKLNSAFNVTGGEKVGGGGGVSIGDPSTRYTGNAAALDFGQTPYSAGNEPGMQQVVSQGGVGE